MRLIDADKLSNKSCPMGKRKYCSNCGEKRTIKNPYTNQSISCDDIRFDFLQMIDREKTVKAIPIEFIEERIKKAVAFTHSKAEGNIIADGCVVTVVSASFTAQVLANLLEAWEGQNEKDI